MQLDQEFHVDFKNLIVFVSTPKERKTRSSGMKIDQIRGFATSSYFREVLT